MATYEGRKRELREALTRIQPTIPIEEYLRFMDRIDRYSTARDEALTSLASLVADTGDAKRESDLKDKLARGRDALKDTLGSALSSVQTPSLPGLVFQNTAVVDENRFWNTLEKLNLGALRDSLMLLTENLEWYIVILEKKWETTTVENTPLLEAEKLATLQVIAWVDQSIAETANKVLKAKKAAVDSAEAIKGVQRDTTEYFADIAKKYREKYLGETDVQKKLGTEFWVDFVRALGPGKWLLAKLSIALTGEYKDAPKMLLEAMRSYGANVRGEYATRALKYLDNIRKQTDGIFVVFSQTRRDTDEFIKKNGLDVAKKQFEEARDALNRWVTDLPTDGLKKDGKDFADALVVGLNRRMNDMDMMFKRFVKENEGRFFGSVRPDITQALTAERECDDHLATLLGRGLGLEEKLREWRSDAHKFVEIDLEDMFRYLKDNLPDQPEEIQEELHGAIAECRKEVMGQARERIAEVDRIVEEMKQLAGKDRMLIDFDRKLLMGAVPR